MAYLSKAEWNNLKKVDYSNKLVTKMVLRLETGDVGRCEGPSSRDSPTFSLVVQE